MSRHSRQQAILAATAEVEAGRMDSAAFNALVYRHRHPLKSGTFELELFDAYTIGVLTEGLWQAGERARRHGWVPREPETPAAFAARAEQGGA